MASVSRLLRQRVLFGRRFAVDLDVCTHKKLLAFFGALKLSVACADAAVMCVLAAALLLNTVWLCVAPPQVDNIYNV